MVYWDPPCAGNFGTFVVHSGTEDKASSSLGSPKASALSVKTDSSTDLRSIFFFFFTQAI